MKHPFEGIIVPEGDADNQKQINRRKALGVIAGAGVAVAAGSAVAQQIAVPPIAPGLPVPPPVGPPSRLPPERVQPKEEQATGEKADQYNLYFVQPKSIRKFSYKRRAELGIFGPYQAGLRNVKELAAKPGFMTWASAKELETLKAAKDVEGVYQIQAAGKTVLGKSTGKGERLMVMLAPNGWSKKPGLETYYSAKAIIAGLQEDFTELRVKFEEGPGGRYINIHFTDPSTVEKVVPAVKGHPQVYQLSWVGSGVSTRARGEEGGGPTTLAVGEEGGPRPTTLAIGEEGGATTRALNEEGGVTTKALGEEGGPTTERLGEEGGRPLTKRLGENGGGVSTQALGEEGGRATTLALGEEGGGIKRLPIEIERRR